MEIFCIQRGSFCGHLSVLPRRDAARICGKNPLNRDYLSGCSILYIIKHTFSTMDEFS